MPISVGEHTGAHSLAEQQYSARGGGHTRGYACVVVLAVRDRLLRCSIAILRVWIVVMIWLSLPIQLLLVSQPIGVV